MITKESALLTIAKLFEESNKASSQSQTVKKAFVPMYPTGSATPKQAAVPAQAPAAPQGMDPAMMQQMLMQAEGVASAGQASPARGESAAGNGAYTGEEEKLSTDDKLDLLKQDVEQLMTMVQAVGDMLFSLVSPQDPAAAGGEAPPMDPAMMDPAMMGGAPMDPAMMGGAPMDPAMMGGAPMDPAMMDPAMMPKTSASQPNKNTQGSLADSILALLSKE